MSGYPENAEDDIQEFGRCAFLQKPFQPGDLMDALLEVAAETAL